MISMGLSCNCSHRNQSSDCWMKWIMKNGDIMGRSGCVCTVGNNRGLETIRSLMIYNRQLEMLMGILPGVWYPSGVIQHGWNIRQERANRVWWHLREIQAWQIISKYLWCSIHYIIISSSILNRMKLDLRPYTDTVLDNMETHGKKPTMSCCQIDCWDRWNWWNSPMLHNVAALSP